MSRSAPLPSPRAHLAASLSLFDALAGAAGGAQRFPGAEAWRALVARPRALPASVPPSMNGMKCDGYLTRSDAGPAWGFACNDRFEGRAFWGIARRLADALPGDYAIDEAIALRDALATGSGLTISVGFDAPGQPPRLKLYIQESSWGTGVGTVGALRALGSEAVGAVIPDTLPDDLTAGVVTVTLLADGSRRCKLYFGESDLQALALQMAAALPEQRQELQRLAETMAATSPSAPCFYYATVRLGRDVRVAVNKIYEHERLGFGANRGAWGDAWGEVERLFRAAGRGIEPIVALREKLATLLLVPTATAVERRGQSADVYLAAWPGGGSLRLAEDLSGVRGRGGHEERRETHPGASH